MMNDIDRAEQIDQLAEVLHREAGAFCCDNMLECRAIAVLALSHTERIATSERPGPPVNIERLMADANRLRKERDACIAVVAREVRFLDRPGTIWMSVPFGRVLEVMGLLGEEEL